METERYRDIQRETERHRGRQRDTELVKCFNKGLAAKQYDLDLVTDEVTKRKLRLLGDIGTSILPPDTLTTFNKLTSSMSKIYSSAKVSFSLYISHFLHFTLSLHRYLCLSPGV